MNRHLNHGLSDTVRMSSAQPGRGVRSTLSPEGTVRDAATMGAAHAGLTHTGLTHTGLTHAGLAQAGLTHAGLAQAGLTQTSGYASEPTEPWAERPRYPSSANQGGRPLSGRSHVDRKTNGPTLATIARLPEQENLRVAPRSDAQVIVLDYGQRDLNTDDRAILSQGGIWLRHAHPCDVLTRVVLHLILPERFAPLTLTGMVAKTRISADQSNPWMLVWFDEASQEPLQFLRHYLRNLQH